VLEHIEVPPYQFLGVIVGRDRFFRADNLPVTLIGRLLDPQSYDSLTASNSHRTTFHCVPSPNNVWKSASGVMPPSGPAPYPASRPNHLYLSPPTHWKQRRTSKYGLSQY
jgi:hypothetical protein